MRSTSTSTTRAATSQETRLKTLIRDDRVELIERLIAKSPRTLSTLDDERRSWLHLAAERGAVATVRWFLASSSRPDLDRLDDDGKSPIHLAVGQGHLAVVQAFLDHGLNVNTPLTVSRMSQPPLLAGRTLLHVAALYRQPAMARFLIEQGAHVDAIDAEGRTSLHMACGITRKPPTRTNPPSSMGQPSTDQDHAMVVVVLLAHGARHDVRNHKGETPLDLARARALRNDVSEGPLLAALEGADLRQVLNSKDLGDTPSTRARPRL